MHSDSLYGPASYIIIYLYSYTVFLYFGDNSEIQKKEGKPPVDCNNLNAATDNKCSS